MVVSKKIDPRAPDEEKKKFRLKRRAEWPFPHHIHISNVCVVMLSARRKKLCVSCK